MSTKFEEIANSFTDDLCKSSKQYNEDLTKYIEKIGNLNRAYVIAYISHLINNLNFSLQDIKKFIKETMDKDQLMKDYVYDIMKDLK